MEEWMILCNMVIEVGGKNGVIVFDEMIFEYLWGRIDKLFELFYFDKNVEFYSDCFYDVIKLEFVVVKFYFLDNKEFVCNC